jgi:hypothetical protein
LQLAAGAKDERGIILNRRPARDQQVDEDDAEKRNDHGKRDHGKYDGNAATKSHKHLRPYCLPKVLEKFARCMLARFHGAADVSLPALDDVLAGEHGATYTQV